MPLRLLLSVGRIGTAGVSGGYIQQRHEPHHCQSMRRLHTRSRLLDWLDVAIRVRTGQPCGNNKERKLRALPSIDVSERDGRVIVSAVPKRLVLSGG